MFIFYQKKWIRKNYIIKNQYKTYFMYNLNVCTTNFAIWVLFINQVWLLIDLLIE